MYNIYRHMANICHTKSNTMHEGSTFGVARLFRDRYNLVPSRAGMIAINTWKVIVDTYMPEGQWTCQSKSQIHILNKDIMSGM